MEHIEQIIFYEYLINFRKCKIMQYKCIGVKVQENLYRAKFNDGTHRLINVTKFELIDSYKVFSFNDDYEHYKQLLLGAYAEMVEKNRAKLEKQEQFLEQLKAN